MKSIPSISLTFDMWKEIHNNIYYLGVTGHYIKDWEICSVQLSCQNFSDRHTADNIRSYLDEIFEFWGIDKSRIIACVTDNVVNVEKAVNDWVGSNKHLPCFAQTLNLAVKSSIQNSGNFQEIFNDVREIVQFFKRSSPAADELRKPQLEEVLMVKRDVDTRWNSSYLMLARYVEMRDYINLALGRLNDGPQPIIGAHRDAIEDALLLLSRSTRSLKICQLKKWSL